MSSKKNFLLAFIAFSIVFVLLCSLFFSFSAALVDNTDRETDLDASYPTVIIDAGHGGEDGGAIGADGSLEKDLNLSIAQKLFDTLTASGINCVMTRSEDILLYDRNQDYKGRKKALDMQARLNIAQKYGDAIFVSIHQNSFPTKKYSGFQVYYSPNNARSQILAQTLENSVREKLQPNNNRASKSSDGKIYLLDKLSCPAVLIECGFLSNPEECALLRTEEYQKRLCETVSDAIISFLNEKRQ